MLLLFHVHLQGGMCILETAMRKAYELVSRSDGQTGRLSGMGLGRWHVQGRCTPHTYRFDICSAEMHGSLVHSCLE